MVSRVTISRPVLEGIRRESATAGVREACGLLFGWDDHVDDFQATENVSENPNHRFEIDPKPLFAALRAERAGGPKLVGYWHSHPSGDATPSATDAAMAAPDGKLWLIVGGDAVTAWRAIETGGFEPVTQHVSMEIDAAVLAEAFPARLGADAQAAWEIVSEWVVPRYHVWQFGVLVDGSPVHIPQRVDFSHGAFENPGGRTALHIANCLMTRSTDGHARQAALREIIGLNQPWSVPFVIALIGEYVIEILDDIEAALPALDRAVVGGFLAANPGYFALTRARVRSYWHCYYGNRFRWRDYVGFRLIAALEAMATPDP